MGKRRFRTAMIIVMNNLGDFHTEKGLARSEAGNLGVYYSENIITGRVPEKG